jgi:hypothetical protein
LTDSAKILLRALISFYGRNWVARREAASFRSPPSGWRSDDRKPLLAKTLETSHLRKCENDGKSVLTP